MWPRPQNIRGPCPRPNNNNPPRNFQGGPAGPVQFPAFRGQPRGPRPNSNFQRNADHFVNNPRGQRQMFNGRPPWQPGPRFQQFAGPNPWAGGCVPNRNRCSFRPGSPNSMGGPQDNRGMPGNWGGPPQKSHPNQNTGNSEQRFDNNTQEHKYHGKHYQNFNHQEGFKGKKKKPKPSKRDLPENNVFFCDTCDRGFKTEDKYEEHVDGHVKCDVDGCSFIAAQKLVQLHYRLQHTTGLAKKIWSLESKEDLEKWKAERRKNYPTAANIEKKKQIQAEKEARGEVIENKYFGNMRGRGGRHRGQRWRGGGHQSHGPRGGGHQGGRQNVDNEKNRISGKRNCSETVDQDLKSECSPKKKCRDGDQEFTPQVHVTKTEGEEASTRDPLAFFLSGDISGSDSGDEKSSLPSAVLVSHTSEDTTRTVAAAGALGSLINSYDDSAEDSDDNAADVKTDETVKDLQICKSKLDSNDREDKRRPFQRHRKGKRKGKGQQKKEENLSKNKNDLFYRANPSLLEKLLANEIRQERNKVLQCVHYIVKKNFFGVGAKESGSGTKIDTSISGSPEKRQREDEENQLAR